MPISGVDQPTASAPTLYWAYFVRIDIAAPVGTKRFSAWHIDITANIDGTSQLWSSDMMLMNVEGIEQGEKQTLSSASFSVGNAADPPLWSQWAQSPGLRSAAVQIYRVQFNAAGSLVASVKRYDGRVDAQEIDTIAHLFLTPHNRPWSRQAPYATPAFLGASALFPKPNVNVPFGPLPVVNS